MASKTIWYDAKTKQQQITKYNDKIEITAWYPNGFIFFEATISDKQIQLHKFNNGKGQNCMLPDGKITVWKACRYGTTYVYVKLKVPRDARRVTVLSDRFKCRVEYADVVDIIDQDGKHYDYAESFMCTQFFKYEVNKRVYADKFDASTTRECTHGIHVHLHKTQCASWFSGHWISYLPDKYYKLIENCHRLLENENCILFTYDGNVVE